METYFEDTLDELMPFLEEDQIDTEELSDLWNDWLSDDPVDNTMDVEAINEMMVALIEEVLQ